MRHANLATLVFREEWSKSHIAVQKCAKEPNTPWSSCISMLQDRLRRASTAAVTGSPLLMTLLDGLRLSLYHDDKDTSLSPCGIFSTTMSALNANAGESALTGFRSKWEKI
ncbi:hypothetical protein N7481_001596 [Penicillium waksmanii]|uniref:uncharacterized protein n=1 Tax=Penicillium waksmanii TaxID=69791 RepID=UPI00254829D0|nr:uncharacterized protein N7481_001574 [Penicillium waksmanii]XP_057128647.1 uncharacterized protein N7481_001596 [Penicillium waksmanii]KAJ6001165.1 hypothetical protein N7481_001574 [Penicillium waksmanii]KAJ6001187.1 hypothetical protein N7481_001596 [Penicillium waksmanii]